MSLTDAVRSILHGVLQYALYLIPLLKPLQEALYPPSWWYRDWGYWDWVSNLDRDRRPNQSFIKKYLFTSFGYLSDKIRDKAASYARSLVDALRNVIGGLPSAFGSVSAWIGFLSGLLGRNLPSWASTVITGLYRLYAWLPSSIRNGWRSWSSLLNEAYDKAIAWARSQYDWVKARVVQIWDWLVQRGYSVVSWWLSARALLDQFRADPRGFIVGRLGGVWSWLVWFSGDPLGRIVGWLGWKWRALVTFAEGPLEYYYNLWGSYKRELGAFLSDPLEFLYDRAESFLSDKMG